MTVYTTLLASVLATLVLHVHSAPFSPLDVFTPACGGLLSDPPPGGWLPWSLASTWGGGAVPGIGGAVGANVTIPCGRGVLLDLRDVQLTVLNIQGALKFSDDPSLPLVNLTAAFIIVEGRFIIGSATQQFTQRAEIRLTPNPNNRANFGYTSREPADPANPRSVGHKAFAVVGGQVDFHGLPGPASMLSWTKLGATARAGATRITVRGSVSNWPVGSPIVIAPTDFYPDQEDVRTITAVSCSAGGLGPCNITLNSALTFNHYGDPLGVPDGFGGFIDETAEVALLRRNIVITGTDEPAPFNLEGGHFIVFFTKTQQIIEGVQFLMMGQQGILGRYNIHFHVCGDDENKSVVRKNLIMHSKQRCVVVHATHNVTVDGNVAYNTSGHCFMVEEGGETGNTFTNNFGLRTRAVTRKIAADETDDVPSTFWITNANNNYINNAAGGSEDSGFWMELRSNVRGLSLRIPNLRNIMPLHAAVLGRFWGNSAHSNLFAGYRAYPHGLFPRWNASADNNEFYDNPVWVEYGNFNLWKNMQVGAFIHNNDHVVFSNSTFADNVQAIRLQEVQGVNLTGHRIVGESNNFGNPSNCQFDWGKWSCGPITGCRFPLAAGVAGRSVPWGLANKSIQGVVFDQNRQYEDGMLVNLLSNTNFSGFDATCHVAAAIGVGGNRQNFWNSGHGFRSVRFANTPVTNRVYVWPRTQRDGESWTVYSGEVATMFAIRDLDGSITGSGGGYIVANNSNILPPSTFTPQCTALPRGNALSCPGTCYRTVQVLYFEPGFAPYPQAGWGQWVDGPRTLGDFSYIQVTRVEDNRTWTMEGNLRGYRSGFDNGQGPYNDTARFYPMSLLGGYTYQIQIIPGTNNPSFVPFATIIQYKDGQGCGRGVTLRFPGWATGSWAVRPTDVVAWNACPGNAAVLNSTVAPAQYSYICNNASTNRAEVLQVALSPLLPSMEPVVLIPLSSPARACSSITRCGLTSTWTRWFYNQRNLNLQPEYSGGPAFYNPLYPTPAPEWQLGRGVLGYEGWEYWGIGTFLLNPDWQFRRTYYFKSSFNLLRSSCYSTLYLDLLVIDGLVVYLNNVEILRVNMPAGTPNNMTQALSDQPGISGNPLVYTYQSFAIPLTGAGLNYSLAEGRNDFSAEVHVNVDNGWNVAFAMRASLDILATCTLAKVVPEVCDGVDNNADGRIDVNMTSGQLLQRPCWTACGAGVQTCTNGAFQGCTAPPARDEVCDGLDNNCDGLVDNGNAQLNCPAGNVCFAGRCQPVQDLTTAVPVWPAKAPNWLYNDTAGVDLITPSVGSPNDWKNRTRGVFSQANGDFGVFPDNPSWQFMTPLAPNNQGNIRVRYFLKNFTLTAAEATSTFGYAIGLRRGDGAVVYLNGRELFRSNMPAGTIAYSTWASTWSSGQNPDWADNAVGYYPFGPLRAYGAATVAGVNWLAVELRPSSQWQGNWVFDLNLTRFAIQPCVAASCVRRPPRDTVFIRSGDLWRYLDSSLALPPANWAAPAFDDSLWLSGRTMIGQPTWVSTRMATSPSRITYVFRQTLNVADGLCFFNLTMRVFANDGVVVYINGAEATRVNMPAGNVTVTTRATTWPSWQWTSVPLSTGWLVNGRNVIAAEVHTASVTSGDWLFDLTLSGQREGVSCTPLPA